MSRIYKICKRTIERELEEKGFLSDEFKADMQTKIDIYAAANKITASEYAELSNMLNS